MKNPSNVVPLFAVLDNQVVPIRVLSREEDPNRELVGLFGEEDFLRCSEKYERLEKASEQEVDAFYAHPLSQEAKDLHLYVDIVESCEDPACPDRQDLVRRLQERRNRKN